MARFDGSLALKLDFGSTSASACARSAFARRHETSSGETALKLAEPDKYKALEHRRRQAQIKARHLLQLMEEN